MLKFGLIVLRDDDFDDHSVDDSLFLKGRKFLKSRHYLLEKEFKGCTLQIPLKAGLFYRIDIIHK